MKSAVFIAVALLVARPCCSRSVDPEESVVSVYTTQPTTAGTSRPFDVYHQIANNIAERITSPIYRFLGLNHTKSVVDATTKKSWSKIELLDESTEDVTKTVIPVVDNDIAQERDVEELSVEALKKTEKKPEKIVLYSSYLPSKQILERNDTVNEISDDDDDDLFNFDDDNEEVPKENNFFYYLQILGSILQLAWGKLVEVFKSSNNSS